MLSRLRKDDSGGVLVEATVLLTIMFVFVLGSVDMLMAMYQWNAAVKAVQHGARIASTSNAVDSTFKNISGAEGGSEIGTMPPDPFATRTCVNLGCSAGTFDLAAMQTIVYGRGNGTACPALAPSVYQAGMCNFFPRVQPQNVSITYSYSGLGYAGRPGGQIPNIRVTSQNLPFTFYFLGALMDFANISIQPSVTVTGEDLSSAKPIT